MKYNDLALFDLDHTLLPIDTDHEWVFWLANNGYAGDPEIVKKQNQEVTDRYHAGTITADEGIKFMLKFLTLHHPIKLAEYYDRYYQEVIRPNIQETALELVKKHHDQGDLCCLISATNTFVIKPVGRALGFEHILGVNPERKNGIFTGNYIGDLSYQAGKITRSEQWLNTLGLNFEHFNKSYFYSDSINDLPLLEYVTHPVATNPDDQLRRIASERNWKILDLFETVTS